MLPENRRSLELLHSSRDGYGPQHLAQAARDKGSILVVIKHFNGNVFGGFSEDTLTDAGCYVAGAFFHLGFLLFSMTSSFCLPISLHA
eukprot:m.26377 g.26377  ORF g.26377 m.26377 type:complete len:88 (+) comp38497_c0_seq1:2-265(+)